MTLDVLEPFRRLEEFDRVIDGFFAQARNAGARQAEPVWRPAADFAADADGYRVWVDLPGVSKEDVEVSVETGVLALRAKRASRTTDSAGSPQHTHWEEIRTGTFERSFRMPKDADTGRVTASLKAGVLELRVPRQKEAQPRKIDVSTER